MNVKKKNKNRSSKQQNPVPQNILQEQIKPSETIDNLTDVLPCKEHIQIKLEERVPEILSDVINTAAPEKDGDNEGPKKPKRNRGKKKKQDDGGVTEAKGETIEITEPQKEITPKEPYTSVDKAQLETLMTPTSRKNKGKNKTNEQTIENTEEKYLKEEKLIDPVPEVKEDDMKQVSKKKNKKRNDSERSEKAEELSCTSAFQKILTQSDEDKCKSKEECQKSPVVEEDKTHKEVSTGSKEFKKDPVKKESPAASSKEQTKNDPIVKNKPDDKIIQEIKCTEQSITDTKEEESQKGKKKNKKEKKQSAKLELDLDKPLDMRTKSIKDTEKNIKSTSEAKEDLPPLQGIEQDIALKTIENAEKKQLETSPKPKAKIAKPVEKKQKSNIFDDNNIKTLPEDSNIKIITLEVIDKHKTDTAAKLTETAPFEISLERKDLPIVKHEKKGTIFPTVPEEKTDEISSTESAINAKCTSEAKEPEKIEDITSMLKTKPYEIPDKTHHKKGKGRKNDEDITKQELKQQMEHAKVVILAELEDKSESQTQKDTTELPTEIPKTDQIKNIECPTEFTKNRTKSPKPLPELEKEVNEEMKIEKVSEIVKTKSQTQKDAIEYMPKIEAPQVEIPIETIKKSKNSPKPLPNLEKEVQDEIKIEKEKVSSVKAEFPPPKDTIELISATETSKVENIVIPTETTKKHKKSPKPLPKSDKEIHEEIKSEKETVSFSKTESQPQKYTIELLSATEDSKVENIEIPTEKTKKRKKSPKTLPKLEKEVHEGIKSEKETVIGKILTSEDNKAYKKQTETDSEIKEVMSSSFQSMSEIGPDVIESPRSTSADIIDTNNNTMIKEINPETLSVPIVIPDTPFIQNSGETPLPTPDIMTSSLKILELNTKGNFKPKVGEKTDLKSKVMEVNKDMEDLRLSIERSLAELTSLENKDNKFEKEYGNKAIQIESIAKDNDMPKIDTEKIITEASNKRECQLEKNDKPKDTPMPSQIVQIDVQSETKLSGTPEPPARKDNKGKQKSKKKGKQETSTQQTTASNVASTTTTIEKPSQDISTETKSEQEKEKTEDSKDKGKQQSDSTEQTNTEDPKHNFVIQEDVAADFDPIENFEDALTSSVDDVNKTFEIIADDAVNLCTQAKEIESQENYEENTDKSKEKADEKQNPLVSQPKNLLGHPPIPVRSNKIDYKKEKNKTPNTKLAKVKLKDTSEIEKDKVSKQSQTENKPKLIKNRTINESVTCVTSENDEYIYKYSFRKVFLSSNCHVCKKDLKVNRVGCNFCNLIFYCSQKHKDEDWPLHQAFCFAVSTIVHLKGQKHLYADCQDVTGHNYRLLRMQAILACEKILKRKLTPHEQETLLYPRICAEAACREWRQSKLKDCDKCGQISYCIEKPDHLSKSHARWCKSYALYQKLVVYQLTNGRLEPLLPTRMATGRIPDSLNSLLANMYDQKIDMNDMQYASLTQLATAPLTAAYSYQLYHDKMKSLQTNGLSKKSFTLHIVGAELQFEADSLHKWETFFLHLKPDVELLNVVLIGPDLNPSNLPLGLLGKIKLCPNCRVDKRRITFNFQDKQLYHDYKQSDDFIVPDLICTFNPSIHRTSCNSDTWSATITEILKHKSPFLITAYTMNELQRDLAFIKNNSRQDFNVISEAKYNPFGSVRPDRNFITDDEIPLLFKNYCYAVLIGAF